MSDFDDLVARVRALRAAGERTLIGIAGAPGAGKTTLALRLVRALGAAAVHVPMDGFHLADVALRGLGLLDCKGAPETFDPGGYAALLRRCAAGEECWAPGFERDLEQPLAQAIPVPAGAGIVVSEGNYLLLDSPAWQAVRACFDEVWFVRTREDVRRPRLVARHVSFGKSPAAARAWVQRVDDVNAALVAGGAGRADLVVDLC